MMKQAGLILVLISLIPAVMTAMGSKVQTAPAAMIKPDIVNMEYQKYAVYNRGEITAYYYYVYTIADDFKTMVLYVGNYRLKNFQTNRPSKLEDLTDRFTIDLEKGTMLHFSQNWSNTMFSRKKTGIFYMETVFDYTNLQADSRVLSWDGYEIKEQKSKITLKAGYSYFCGTEIFPAVLRFLDPLKPGIVYFAVPGYLNAAVGCSFRVIGKEDLSTPAGDFKTLRVNFTLEDQLVANLIKGYTDGFILWVDPSTGITVKNQLTESSVFELVEKGIWTNSEQEDPQ